MLRLPIWNATGCTPGNLRSAAGRDKRQTEDQFQTSLANSSFRLIQEDLVFALNYPLAREYPCPSGTGRQGGPDCAGRRFIKLIHA